MKWSYVLMLSLGLAAGLAIDRPDEGAEEEDTYLTPVELIKKYGYPVEEHVVQSDDGYLITLHRIPYGRLCSAEKSRGPAYVQHGLLSSGGDWIVSGTKRGLPYILADNCYDVWLGNSRGTTLSKKHAYLDVNSHEYWDFSWHEMGQYDIPAITRYILHVSKKENLYYIGHSQGTTQFFIYCSLYPEDCEKNIKVAVMLAPIAFFENSKLHFLETISKFQSVLGWVAGMIGLDEFLPHTDFITNMGKECSDQHPNMEELCNNIVFSMFGADSEQFNMTMIPIFLGHIPGGAATKQFLHYAQLFNSGKFRQYDYGRAENKKRYGQAHPPDYDLGKVTAPTHLFYSLNDELAAVPDVENISRLLGNLAGYHKVPLDTFTHLDYVIAVDVVSLLYDELITILDTY